MLTATENERLTQVGPGTPMGALFRRYWHPIATTGELAESPTKVIRLLGEDLVLYRDRSGTYGLIDRLCAPTSRSQKFGERQTRVEVGFILGDGGLCFFQLCIVFSGRVVRRRAVTQR